MSFSSLTPLGLSEVEGYLRSQHPAAPVYATCLHNTEEPDLASWRGLSSMQGIRRYHMNERGGSDIYANLYVDAERVWTARPLDRDNWAHAYVQYGKKYANWTDVHADAKRLCDGNRLWLNQHAIGVEVVGRFDRDDPTTSPSMSLALDLFALMHRIYNIPLTNLLFHRMVEYKTCPGTRVSLDWFRAEVSERLGQPIPEPAPKYTLVGLDGVARPGPWMGEDQHGYIAIATAAQAADVNVTWDGAKNQWTFSPKA